MAKGKTVPTSHSPPKFIAVQQTRRSRLTGRNRRFCSKQQLHYSYHLGFILCNKSKLKLKRNLPACILGCWLPIDYQSDFLKKLNQMKVDNSKYKRKYKNTIDFINAEKEA
jgi:hypothetical protein